MIDSISKQTLLPSEVIIVNDGGYLYGDEFGVHHPNLNINTYNVPWNLGVVAALNIGVGISKNYLTLLGCADDKLLPRCIELCMDAWHRHKYPLGYYYLGVEYSTGQLQNVACGAAMVTEELWDFTGGFPAQCSVGAADHIFIHGLLVASYHGAPVKIIRVSDEQLYWYRQESNLETSRNIWPAIEAVKVWYGDQWISKLEASDDITV